MAAALKLVLVSGHFQPAWEWGGVVSVTWELARALAAQGVEVTVLTTDAAMTPRRPPPAERVEQGVRVITSPVIGGGRSVLANRMALSAGSLAMAAPWVRRADLVHINGLWSPHVVQVWGLCRLWRRPYLVSPHGNLEGYSLRQSALRKRLSLALYARRILTGARAMHYTVENERREAPAWLRSTPSFIVPCVVKALPAGDGQRFRARFGLGADEPLLGMVGRIHEKKGFDLMLPALARAAGERPAKLIVVGPEEGEYLAAVEGEIARLGLEARVLLTGELHGQELADAYAGFDLLVLPSHEENFGLVVVEANMQGTPVAVSEFVGSKNWVERSGGGVVLPRQEAEWVELIEGLGHPDHPAPWRLEGLAERAREVFSAEAVGAAMLREYEALLG